MKAFLVIVVFLFILWNFVPAEIEKRVGDGGIYYSENGGETWEHTVIEENRFLMVSLDILSLAVHPGNSDILYLGAKKEGLYKSYSRGRSWYQITGIEKNISDGADVYDIAIDPQNPDRIYLAVKQNKKGRVFRSENSGESWEEVYVIADKKHIVSKVAIDNYNPSVIYIGTTEGGFLKSEDCGKTWQIVKWFEDAVSEIAINSQDTQEIYVGLSHSGVYKTNDKGGVWSSLEENLEEFDGGKEVSAIAIDPRNQNTIYIGSLYGLLVSGDKGLNWRAAETVASRELTPVLLLILGSDGVSQIFYGADSVLYRSLDGGENWTVRQLPTNRKIKEIVIDPQNSDLIYVGVGK